MASPSSPSNDGRKSKFQRKSPVGKNGEAGDTLLYMSDVAWNWQQRSADKSIAPDPKGMGRLELIFCKQAPINLLEMVEAANQLSAFIECEQKSRELASAPGEPKDCLTFHFFSMQGYSEVLQFLRKGGINSLPDVTWMNEFKTFSARRATMTIVRDNERTITVKALAATVPSPNGRGISQFLMGDPMFGVPVGRDVQIMAPTKEACEENILDLKALAEEAGFIFAQAE